MYSMYMYINFTYFVAIVAYYYMYNSLKGPHTPSNLVASNSCIQLGCLKPLWTKWSSGNRLPGNCEWVNSRQQVLAIDCKQ